jgi:hypothetical protein
VGTARALQDRPGAKFAAFLADHLNHRNSGHPFKMPMRPANDTPQPVPDTNRT